MTKHTVSQLKKKLKDAWLRGKEQRIEIGTLLIDLRNKAKHGEWGKLLTEIGIPATTATDYMAEASRQIHGIRVFDKGEITVTKPDAETVEMEQAVQAAKDEVTAAGDAGDPPTPPATIQPEPSNPQLEEHNCVRGPDLYCTATQKEAFRAAMKADHDRVYQIFHAALMAVIDDQQEEVVNETVAA